MIDIVIPVFNEEKNIPELWTRLKLVIDSGRETFKVIFVNDGSSDRTKYLLKNLQTENPGEIKIISFSRNFGISPAVTAGLSQATGDAVIIMDADLQDRPEAIFEMIGVWKQGFSVVYAIRSKRKEFCLKRMAFKNFYRLQSFFADLEIPPDSGLFSLLDRKILDVLKNIPERNRYVPGLRAFAGFKQKGIVIERDSRFSGNPSMSFRKLFQLASDGIYSTSYLPLRMIGYVGVIIAFAAFLLAFFVIGLKLFTNIASPGWASNLAATFFLGGIQLIFLGVIGEYLRRIYDEVRGRPYYIIEEISE